MAEEINLKVNVSGDGEGKKSISDIRKELVKAEKTAKKVGEGMGKGFDQAATSINKTNKALKDTGAQGQSVKTRLKALKDEMSNIGDVGSRRFQELAVEAGKLKDQMNNANSAIKSMSSDFGNLQTGIGVMQGIGAASQIAAGAQLLLGEENKDLAKSLQRVMALTTMMSGVQTVANTLSDEHIVGQRIRLLQQKLLNRATVQQAVANGTATISQKILNAVMRANPIGIIITGVALLIAGFIAFKKPIMEFISNWENLRIILLAMLGPIGWIIIAYEKLWSKEAKEQNAKDKREQKRKDDFKQELKDIDKLIEKNKQAAEEFRKAKEKEIAINEKKILIIENEGKSSFALRLQILEDNNAIVQSYLDQATEFVRLERSKWEARKTFSGLSEEAFRDQMKAQGVDLAALEEESSKIIEGLELDVKVSESEITAFKREELSKRSKDSQAAAAKEKAAEDKRLKEIEDRIKKERQLSEKKLDKLFTRRAAADAKLLDLQVKKSGDELAALDLAHQKKIEKLDETIPEEHELILFYEQDLRDKKVALQMQWDEEDAAIEDKRDADKKEKREKIFSDTVESGESLIAITESINTIANGKDTERLKAKLDAGERLTASEIKRLKRQEKIEKAVAIARIAIDTAKAISGAVAAGAGVPFPGNIPAILSGVAAVIANVATANKILGESADFSGGDAGEEVEEIADQTPNADALGTGSTLLNGQPNEVYVVESNITGVQNNVKVIEAQATFS